MQPTYVKFMTNLANRLGNSILPPTKQLASQFVVEIQTTHCFKHVIFKYCSYTSLKYNKQKKADILLDNNLK